MQHGRQVRPVQGEFLLSVCPLPGRQTPSSPITRSRRDSIMPGTGARRGAKVPCAAASFCRKKQHNGCLCLSRSTGSAQLMHFCHNVVACLTHLQTVSIMASQRPLRSRKLHRAMRHIEAPRRNFKGATVNRSLPLSFLAGILLVAPVATVAASSISGHSGQTAPSCDVMQRWRGYALSRITPDFDWASKSTAAQAAPTVLDRVEGQARAWSCR